jgi:hypothetical protein
VQTPDEEVELPPTVKMPVKLIVSSQRDYTLIEKAKEDGVIKDFFSKSYELREIDKVKEEYTEKF